MCLGPQSNVETCCQEGHEDCCKRSMLAIMRSFQLETSVGIERHAEPSASTDTQHATAAADWQGKQLTVLQPLQAHPGRPVAPGHPHSASRCAPRSSCPSACCLGWWPVQLMKVDLHCRDGQLRCGSEIFRLSKLWYRAGLLNRWAVQGHKLFMALSKCLPS